MTKFKAGDYVICNKWLRNIRHDVPELKKILKIKRISTSKSLYFGIPDPKDGWNMKFFTKITPCKLLKILLDLEVYEPKD